MNACSVPHSLYWLHCSLSAQSKYGCELRGLVDVVLQPDRQAEAVRGRRRSTVLYANWSCAVSGKPVLFE